MRLISRTVELLRTEGPQSTARRIATWFHWKYVVYRDHARFDRKFGVETMLMDSSYLANVRSENVSLAVPYEPTNWREFKRMMQAIPIDRRQFTFIDAGSGKGRVLMFAALLQFPRIIGVEFSDELVGVARTNIARFRQRKRTESVIDLRCQDIATFDFPAANVLLYLYNPFGAELMRVVIEKLRVWAERGRHDLYIAYRNQTCADLFEAQPFLQVIEKTRDHAIYRVRRAG